MASQARRDRILTLSSKSNNDFKHRNIIPPRENTPESVYEQTSIDKNKSAPKPTVTDIEVLFNRPFEWVPIHPSEYGTSYDSVQTYANSLKLKAGLDESGLDKVFDENVDIFHNSDDDRDGDYIPELDETFSNDEDEEQMKRKKRKTISNYDDSPSIITETVGNASYDDTEKEKKETRNQSTNNKNEEIPKYDKDKNNMNKSGLDALLCHEVFNEIDNILDSNDDNDCILDVEETKAQKIKNYEIQTEASRNSVVDNQTAETQNNNIDIQTAETRNSDIDIQTAETRNSDIDTQTAETRNSDIDTQTAETRNSDIDTQNEQTRNDGQDTERGRNNDVEIRNAETSNNVAVNGETRNNGFATDIALTKAGNPRKRKKYQISLQERQEIKKQKEEQKLELKDPCGSTCRLKCTTKINDIQRREINSKYVKLSYEAQGLYIKCLVDTKDVANRANTGKEVPRRKCTYTYFMKPSNCERTEVCKTFFLSTLGYKPTNDMRLMGILKKAVDCQQSKRGSYQRTNIINKEVIKEHVMTYNPSVSHYRREHAPNKLYLPSDLTITYMHSQFHEFSVSLEVYRKVVTNDMNISFAHLGHEECEHCACFKLHDRIHNETPEIFSDTCDKCKNFLLHKTRYTETRIEYKNDVELVKNNNDTIYYSADLQKVVMLPRMEQYKLAIFCPRIIAFNESFVPLGKSSKDIPFAAVWHECISGRKQEDLISTFRAFLCFHRDAKNVILWLDNCAAQNKNWAFMSFLVNIINSDLIGTDSITIKYFEPGHSFMSADSFHHQVELAMKAKSKVYDFQDFINCVQMANSKKNYVKVMELPDFYNYKDHSSQHKLRKNEQRTYLKDIMAVNVERGSFTLKYKTSHNAEFESTLDFLQTKIFKTHCFPETMQKVTARGITAERKSDIINKLVPLMPENRRSFWNNIPTCSSDIDDLTREY